MNANETREKTLEELQQLLSESLKEHLSLRMQHASNQLGDNSQLKKVRRKIARIKTVIKQKQIEA